MLAKLIAFLLTVLVLLAAGTVVFFMMLVAMNGFSESDAIWGLGVYVILTLLVTVAMGTGGVLLIARFIKKGFSPLVSCLIAVPVFSLIGMLSVLSSVFKTITGRSFRSQRRNVLSSSVLNLRG